MKEVLKDKGGGKLNLSKLDILNILNKYSQTNNDVKKVLNRLEENDIVLNLIYKQNFKNELELMIFLFY